MQKGLDKKQVWPKTGMLNLCMPSGARASAPDTAEGRLWLRVQYTAEDAYRRLEKSRAFYHGQHNIEGHSVFVLWGVSLELPDLHHNTCVWDATNNFYSRIIVDPTPPMLTTFYSEFLAYTANPANNHLLLYSRLQFPKTLYSFERLKPETSNVYPINLEDESLDPMRNWMRDFIDQIGDWDMPENIKMKWYRFMDPSNCKRAIYEFLKALAHKVEV